MAKAKGSQKHRLVLLLGVAVALVFFYLGVNTWIESQQKQIAPPPVVRANPPVEIKKGAPVVKPEEPTPTETQEEKPRPIIEKIQPVKRPQPKEEKKEETKEVKTAKEEKAQKPITQSQKKEKPTPPVKREEPKKTEVAKVVEKKPPTPTKREETKATQSVKPKAEQPKKPVTKPAPQSKEEKVVVAKIPKEKPKKLKEFVLQVGAFKNRKNALRTLNSAKKAGYEAFLIEEEGLYKVRVREKADSFMSALKRVRSNFKSAFIVR